MRKRLEIPANAPTAIPPRYYQWYVLFWHIVYLGMLALAIGLLLWTRRVTLS